MAAGGRQIASVSWGDHIEWGEGSARLASPDDFARSVDRWIERDGADRIHFRENHYYTRYGRPVRHNPRSDTWLRPTFDESDAMVRSGRVAGVPVHLYATIYDELWLDTDWAWPWDPATNWLSEYVREHPGHTLVDRAGLERLHGVLDYNEPEAREYRVRVLDTLLGDYEWQGLFICTRSQSRPARQGDQFGYNEASARLYAERWGADPRTADPDIDAWRAIRGEGLTALLRDLRTMTQRRGIELSIGTPRGDFMGPPIGNLRLDWRTWLAEGLVDALVVGQLNEICPSAWVHLWPEAPVEGHLLDPVRGVGLRTLDDDLDSVFGPACAAAGAGLYLSRLHDHPDPALEARLVAEHRFLAGIQYSTFRRDLAEAAAALPWRHTLDWPDGRNAWDPDRGLIRLELPT